MFSCTFDKITNEYRTGVITQYGYSRPDLSYGPITIAKDLAVYHSKTKTHGIMTHVGDGNLAMAEAGTGNQVKGRYDEFKLADPATGKPLPDTTHDIIGVEIKVGDCISFPAPAGQNSFDVYMGIVTGFTKGGGINTIYLAYQRQAGKRTARHGRVCVVLPDDSPVVIAFRQRLDDAS